MSQYSSLILTDLPASGSFWLWDEASGTLVDSGGGAHNSTDNSFLHYQQTGPLATSSSFSLGFDGTNSSTGFGTAIFEFLGTTSYSLECWIKPYDLTNNPFAFQKQNAAEGWYLRLLAAGNVRMGRLQASATDQLDTASAPLTARYNHIVGTYNGTNQQIYVNGVSAAGPTASAKSIQTVASTVSLGGLAGGGNKLTGQMALPAIYPGVVLSSAQVLAHYQAAFTTSTGWYAG